jgi:hypothetical protein
VNQLLDHAALLVQARSRQSAALDGIEHTQQMLPFAKYNLRRPYSLALRSMSH